VEPLVLVKVPYRTILESIMAAKKKGTLAKAQGKFLKALRDFEKTVAGMVTSPAPKSKAKKKAKRKTKARGR
jgi:hypothetical protein